ncbi:hypothetical protein EBU58_10735, partial [bacterium]|nr:hypothetical protein [bacterium]
MTAPQKLCAPECLQAGRVSSRFLTSLVVLAGLLATVCLAKPASAIEAGMPNPPASPTEVTCGLMILDVIDIDDVNESFEAEVVVLAEWDDPRLAFDAEAEGVDRKIFQGDFQFAEVFTGWWPQLLLVNEVGAADPSAVKIEVYPDGHVRYLDQHNAVLETPMNLEDYPFDSQELQVQLDDKKVALHVDDDAIDWFVENGYDKSMGARPMLRLIQTRIKKPLAED